VFEGLTNKNPVPMELGVIAATDGFQITATSCTSMLGANGGTCSVWVAFAPLTSGRITGILTIPDNAAGNLHKVRLTGMGVTASPSG